MQLCRSESLSRLLVVLCLPVMLVAIASCGLAVSSEEKLERGQQAFDEKDFRVAIIRAKSVLVAEPDNAQARVLLGKASVAIGDGVSAQKEFNRALDLGVGLEEIAVEYGKALLQQQKFNELLANLSPEIALDRDRTIILRLRAEALAGLGRTLEARDAFYEVLSDDSADLDAQLGVVRTYLIDGNVLHARETLNQLLAANDSFVPALHLSGLLSLEARDFRSAASDFRRAADLSKKSGDAMAEISALYGLTDALLQQEPAGDSDAVLTRMSEINPDDWRTRMVVARLAMENQEWDRAQQILQQVLREIPDFRPAQLLLGTVHKESGNLGQAEMYLSSVVAAMPNNANARRLLAETRLLLNRSDAARQVLNPITERATADVVSLSMAAGASLILGDTEGALSLLERAIAAEPDNLDLRIQLATTYYRAGQSADAKRVIDNLPDMTGKKNEFQRDLLVALTQLTDTRADQALANIVSLRDKWPDRIEVHWLVGSVQMAVGDFESALGSLNGALAISPDDLRTMRYLAELDIAVGELESARDRFLTMLELAPGDANTMLSLARLAARSEDHSTARQWLERAREEDATSIDVRSMLAALYLAQRDFDRARVVAKEAVEIDSGVAKNQYILGLAYHYVGNYRDAESALSRAVQLDPEEPSYRVNLARTQWARGNTASAMAMFRTSVDRTLEHIPSGVMMASIAASTGNLREAQEIARRLRKMHPNEPAPYALEADILAREGNVDAAIALLDEAMRLDMTERTAIRAFQLRSQAGRPDALEPLVRFLEVRPLDANMRNYLAQEYRRNGEIERSSREYEVVLKQDPDNVTAINNLAWNLFITDGSGAEEYARRAFALSPKNSAVVDTLGWILTNKGYLDEGIQLLRSAVEMSDGQPEFQYHLAAALAKSGKRDEASAILTELIDSGVQFKSKSEAQNLLASIAL